MEEKELLRILKTGVSRSGKIAFPRILQSEGYLKNSSECFNEFIKRTQKYHSCFDIVCGVGRKGGYLGSVFSFLTKKPFISINPSGTIATNEHRYLKEWIAHCDKGNVLIIDDICTSALEYSKSKTLLESFGFDVVGGAVVLWHDLDSLSKNPGKEVFYLFSTSQILEFKP